MYKGSREPEIVLRHCIRRGDTQVPSNKDVTSLYWNVNSGYCEQQFSFHRASTFDVDWQSAMTLKVNTNENNHTQVYFYLDLEYVKRNTCS